MRLLAALAFTSLLWALPALAQQVPNPYLAQARVFYQGLEYERCLQRLEQAAQRESPLAEQAEIALYAGLCNAQLGNLERTESHFARALELDRTIALPPYTSPKISAVFEAVAAKLPQPSTVAPEKRVLTPATGLPPEYPGLALEARRERSYVAPLAFGGAALLAGGAVTYFGLQAQRLEGQANAAHFESDAYRLGNDARQSAVLANIGLGVAAAAVSGAVVTWLLGGQGEPAAPTASSPR